jgi:hypothetical protein
MFNESTLVLSENLPAASPVFGVQFAPRVVLAHPTADLAEGVRR